jgi:hypothetical protein
VEEWKNRGGDTPSRNRHMGAITAAVVSLSSDSKSSLVENQARLVSQCATESC